MESLAILESELQHLTDLSKASSKLLDAFSETSFSIEQRTKRIRQDVTPWEAAQENITLTIEEMTRASRSYHTPSFVPLVLSKREKNPILVCKTIDHLIYAQEYIGSKPSNDYGDKIMESMTGKLNHLAQVSDDLILSAFVAATNKWGSGATSLNDFRTPKKRSQPSLPQQPVARVVSSHAKDPLFLLGGIIRNREPLLNIDQLIKKVYESYNSTVVVETELKQLFSEKLKSALDIMFDATYCEENEESRAASSTHINLAQVARHYQKGDHRLLKISAKCRQLVSEVSQVYHEFVLQPLNDDPSISAIPGELATMVFEEVMRRARIATAYDLQENSDPTRMFVASRGAGIGLCPAGANTGKYFRDCLFLGLDLVPELWKWKEVAASLSGDATAFVDVVEESLTDFLERARRPLDVYADAKGGISSKMLEKLTVKLSSTDWFPSFDCTAHESSTNLLYLLKVLYTDYFGSTKLALQGGNVAGADDDDLAIEQVEDFTRRCVEGTVQDLRTIAETAIKMQKDDEEKRGINIVKLAVFSLAKSDQARCRLDDAVFLVNNATFLLEHFKSEMCFSSRTKRIVEPDDDDDNADDDDQIESRNQSELDDEETGSNGSSVGMANVGITKKKKAKGPVVRYEPLVASLLDYLEEVKDDAMSAFESSWHDVFPETDDPILESALDMDVGTAGEGETEEDETENHSDDHDDSEDGSHRQTRQKKTTRKARRKSNDILSKEQRNAVKHWYGKMSTALRRKVDEGTVHVIMDARVRTELINRAVTVVEEKLRAMENLLEGKRWSSRPLKWMRLDVEGWVNELQKMF